MSCSGRKVVFVKSSMLVVRITKNPCKSWYIAAYLGILYPVQRLPWQTNNTFSMFFLLLVIARLQRSRGNLLWLMTL